MRSDNITVTTCFVGSGSGIAFVQSVRSALAENINRDSDVYDSEMVPGEDAHLSARNSPDSLWYPDEVLSNTIEEE